MSVVLDFRVCRTIYTGVYYHLFYNYTDRDQIVRDMTLFFRILYLYLRQRSNMAAGFQASSIRFLFQNTT